MKAFLFLFTTVWHLMSAFAPPNTWTVRSKRPRCPLFSGGAAEPEESAVMVELDFGGESVMVKMSSPDDAEKEARRLATQIEGVDVPSLQHELANIWESATSKMPPVYEGPKYTGDDVHHTIELPSGLTIQVAPSTIPSAGLGLFVKGPQVLQIQGSAFCGYGQHEKITHNLDGLTKYQLQRTFQFLLEDGLESSVWYDGELVSMLQAVELSNASGVKGHTLTKQEGTLALVPDTDTQCYIVPPSDTPPCDSLKITSVGQMANDLAGPVENYEELSEQSNLLVLVPRVALKNGILEPAGMPVLTMSRSVLIGEELMEIGLTYGSFYWTNSKS